MVPKAPQMDLFGFEPPPDDSTREVEPADATDELKSLAAGLPSGLRLGGSTWSFPGWQGLVYAHKESSARLAKAGLHAYAQHPLLRMVGVDRTFYGPMSTEAF